MKATSKPQTAAAPKLTNLDKRRLEFAKQVEYMYEASQPSWRRVLSFSLLKGLATGFGVFLGGTIVVALLLWILSGLGHVPLLNDLTDNVRDTLQQSGD